MKPWFDDLPLDFTRDETRAAARLLATGYPMNLSLLTLAQDAGLDLTRLDQMRPVKYLARDVLSQARLSNRLLVLLAEVRSDPAQEAIHGELNALIAGHEGELRQAAMGRKPSLSTLARLPPDVDVWSAGHGEPQPLATPGLEKTINAAAGFADPALLRERIAEAEVRTARIEIGGKAEGTGFLVGADLLMTSWHVVEGGVDGAVARFDKASQAADGRPVPFADDWLAAHSEHEAVEAERSAGGPPEGTWDFAVVRLVEAAGDQAIGPDPSATNGDLRGHYALDGSLYRFDAVETLFIVGYPKGRTVQLSHASPAGARLTDAKNRVRYDTNTEGGSSGSPVFNRDWRVVALHHAWGSAPAAFNQGVPISGIAAELRAQLDGRPELTVLGLA